MSPFSPRAWPRPSPLGPLVPLLFLLSSGLLLGVTSAPVQQGPSASPSSPPPHTTSSPAAPDTAVIRKAARAVQAGRVNQAIVHLSPLMQGTIPRHPRYGSAATWLGRAFAHRGDTTQARNVWLLGLRADRRGAEQPPPADAADAFLRATPPSVLRDSVRLATEVYLRLLRAMGHARTVAADTTLRRHAAQLALIAPDSVAASLSAYASAPSPAAPEGDLPDSTVAAAATQARHWLRAQDPVLATTGNERIAEHLIRIWRAERSYRWAHRPSGLDDRGEILVRYGLPEEKFSVGKDAVPERYWEEKIDQGAIDDKDVDPGGADYLFGGKKLPSLATALQMLDVGPGGFPAAENEVWVYRTLTPAIHFIFVRRPQRAGYPYLEGTARDLLPFSGRLSAKPNLSQKSINYPVTTPSSPQSFLFQDAEWKAYFTLYLKLYSQLMPADPRYGARYDRLLSYDRVSDGPGDVFMNVQMGQNRAENRRMQREQAEAPTQRTRARPTHSSMPVAVRSARFLNENGTTRTEVYWSVRTDSLRPSQDWMDNAMRLGAEPSGTYVIRATGVIRGVALRPEAKAQTLDTLSVSDVNNRDRLAPRSLILRGPASRRRVSLEWMQRSIDAGGGQGPMVHYTTRQLGPRPALPTDTTTGTMSDLRLLSVPERGAVLPETDAEIRRRVIPFRRVATDRRIALNFEIYRLAFGPADRTRYTVEYSASYERDKGGLAGLFGATESSQTSTSSTYEGSRRRTQEFILLGLDNLGEIAEPTPVTVTVRVTDEVTEQTHERTLSLTLVPSTSLRADDLE